MYNSTRLIILKRLTNSIIILLSAGVIGSLLLLVVYALPVEPMRDNVARGTQVYNSEGNFPELAAGYKSTKLDNDTDSTMLANAIYPVSDIVKDAFSVPMIGYKSRNDRISSLLDYSNRVKGATYVTTYPRYWHGYLTILKPLLLFFDFSDIRVFNMNLQFMLVSLSLILLFKANTQSLPAFIALIVVWNPTTISLSFQNSSCFYITIIALLYILFKNKALKINNIKLPYFFLLLGIVTVYFDFLTYPLVTLAIPLTLLLNISLKTLLENIKAIFLNSIFWVIGYIGMWVEKWLIASIVLKQNIMLDGINQFLLRSSKELEGNSFSLWECIYSQISVLLKWPYLVFFSGLLIFIIIYYYKRLNISTPSQLAFTNISNILLPYIILCLYPFIWYCIASNHCYSNPKFTYRLLGITVFASISGILKYLNSLNRCKR